MWMTWADEACALRDGIGQGIEEGASNVRAFDIVHNAMMDV